jgi:hypothetical protein
MCEATIWSFLIMVNALTRSAVARLAALALMGASMAWAAGSVQPASPGTLCVNGKCAATTTGGGIKWHPGHYLDGSTFTALGNSNLSTKIAEANMVRSGPQQVLGYEQYYYWRTFEQGGAGVYDFSTLDTDYVNITGYTGGKTTSASYNAPRRLGIYFLHTDYFTQNAASRLLPDYLLSNSVYGAGADGQHTGYWTTTGSQGAGTGSVVAFWRPAVMARLQALMTALAHHVLPDGYTVDTSPYVEWIKPYLESCDDPENPNGGAMDTAADPTYTTASYLAQLEALNVTMAAAFPHTTYATTANFMLDPGSAYSLVQTFASSRSGESGPDVFGYSSGQNVCNGLCGLTFGQAAYIGLKPNSGSWNTPWVTGGTDLRGVVPAVLTVQCTEMVSDCGAHYSAADLFQQANSVLHASHIAWSYIVAGQYAHGTSDDLWYGTASGASNWNAATSGGVLATIVNNPLTYTACPKSYTSGCNTN